MGMKKLTEGASLDDAFADVEAEKFNIFNRFVDEMVVGDTTKAAEGA